MVWQSFVSLGIEKGVELMRVRKRRLIIALVTAATIIHIPVMAAVVPDAGQTDKSIQERQLVAPAQSTIDLAIHQQQTEPKQADQGLKIRVDHIRFTGQTIFSEETLLAQIQDGLEKELSLNDLELLAWQITRYLRSQGYLVATAYIPAQDVQDNTVNIAVVLGQYGNIQIRNSSALAIGRVRALLSEIHSGDVIRKDSLERAMLLVDDASGVSAKATLAPGEAPGTADLIVDVIDASRVIGSLTVDNHGNWFTGENRLGLAIDLNNPSGIGDQATLGGTYAGSGMDNRGLSYLVPVGRRGGNLGVSYERTHYLLGKDFSFLNANGEAKTTSVFGTYPFVRSRSLNIYGRLGFNDKKLEDRLDAVDTFSDKRSRVWKIELNGDRRDKDGRGLTAFALALSTGRLDINTPADLVIDQASAKSAGWYNKTSLSLLGMKQINERLSYKLSFSGQLASKNLDSSEKLYLGGATGVRAYPEGEAAGDDGYIFTGELHWNMPKPNFQLAAFIDTGRITINKEPWDNAANHRTLSGAGMGVIWNWDEDYSLRFDYAWKLNSDNDNSDSDSNGRFWLQCTRKF
ncbi:MAG: hxuB 1 [Firmicutes bacterium]|nr:hxuB 1 [Bacillota bacterium]